MKIVLIDENKEFQVKAGDIIFDTLDNQGHQLPHGCLAGSCGACKIEISSGDSNLEAPSAIELNTVKAVCTNLKRIHGDSYLEGKTVRLACRAKVKGDVSIKVIN